MAGQKNFLSPASLCFAALLQAGAAVALIPGNSAMRSLEEELTSMEKIFPESFFERTLFYADAFLDGGRLPEKILLPVRQFLIPERHSKNGLADAKHESSDSACAENSELIMIASAKRSRHGHEKTPIAHINPKNGTLCATDAHSSETFAPDSKSSKRDPGKSGAIDAPWWFSYVEQRIAAVKALIVLIALRIAAVLASVPFCAAFLGAAAADCAAMRKSRAARAVPPHTGRYRSLIVFGKLSAFGAAVCLLWPWAENPLLPHACLISSCLFFTAAFAQLRSKAKI